MQDISIRYDETLPVPYQLTVFDGYVRIEANPRQRARIPLWLLEIMQNDILARVPTVPHYGQPALPADHAADVIDLRTRRVRAV